MRFLVLQMPVAHIVIFVVLNLIYIEDIPTFDIVVIYFIPFIAITVLGGIWGFNLAIRMMAPYYVNLKLVQKYFAFQLVLFFCKIQPILLNVVLKALITTCEGPFTIVVKRHSELSKFLNIAASINHYKSSYVAIIQMLVQFQMLILCIWASFLYKNPLPSK